MNKQISRRKFIAASATLLAASYNKEVFANLLKSESQKIFIFSKHLQWLNYKEMAEMTKLLGFDGVDLTVRPEGHVLPENVESDLPKAVTAIRKEGLIIDTITTAITDVDDPHTIKILKTASDLGIKQYRMGWYVYKNNLPMRQNLEIIKQKFAGLNSLNEKYNIRGDYQNHSGDGFGSVIWDIYQIFEDINTDRLGIRYDIRHAVVEGGTSWRRTLPLVYPFVKSIGIKDLIWVYDPVKSEYYVKDVQLGEGMVNFNDFFSLLKKYSLNSNITLYLEYELGGANDGGRKLKISVEEFRNKVKKDLLFIKNHGI